jgi:hypothetical protein
VGMRKNSGKLSGPMLKCVCLLARGLQYLTQTDSELNWGGGEQTSVLPQLQESFLLTRYTHSSFIRNIYRRMEDNFHMCKSYLTFPVIVLVVWVIIHAAAKIAFSTLK